MQKYKNGMDVIYKDYYRENGKWLWREKTGKIKMTGNTTCMIAISTKYCSKVDYEDILRIK